MTDHIPTAEEVDQAVRHAINTAIAFEASSLSPTEHARLKLCLADPSEDVSEIIDTVMAAMCDQLSECICLVIGAVALEPGDE